MLNRRYRLGLITFTLLGGIAASFTGCSEETNKVAEGDPAARRKQKDDALDRMSNPFGTAPKAVATKTKGKTGSGTSKNGANVPLNLP
jgi:hypothetical protein